MSSLSNRTTATRHVGIDSLDPMYFGGSSNNNNNSLLRQGSEYQVFSSSSQQQQQQRPHSRQAPATPNANTCNNDDQGNNAISGDNQGSSNNSVVVNALLHKHRDALQQTLKQVHALQGVIQGLECNVAQLRAERQELTARAQRDKDEIESLHQEIVKLSDMCDSLTQTLQATGTHHAQRVTGIESKRKEQEAAMQRAIDRLTAQLLSTQQPLSSARPMPWSRIINIEGHPVNVLRELVLIDMKREERLLRGIPVFPPSTAEEEKLDNLDSLLRVATGGGGGGQQQQGLSPQKGATTVMPAAARQHQQRQTTAATAASESQFGLSLAPPTHSSSSTMSAVAGAANPLLEAIDSAANRAKRAPQHVGAAGCASSSSIDGGGGGGGQEIPSDQYSEDQEVWKAICRRLYDVLTQRRHLLHTCDRIEDDTPVTSQLRSRYMLCALVVEVHRDVRRCCGLLVSLVERLHRSAISSALSSSSSSSSSAGKRGLFIAGAPTGCSSSSSSVGMVAQSVLNELEVIISALDDCDRVIIKGKGQLFTDADRALHGMGGNNKEM